MKHSGATRESVYKYIQKQYSHEPEYLWRALPWYAVFRRSDNKKWYALIMDLPRNKIGLDGDERIDVLDIKCSPYARDILLKQKGFIPAYHLDRENWISVLLDGTVDEQSLFPLIAESFELARGNQKKPPRYKPTSILVPANPKYYDIQKAFADSDEILWKQSSSVIVGDTVYLYLAAPYSCIMYKCIATEVDIPYEYSDSNISMQKVMKIKRLHTYASNEFTIEILKKHGVASVRGPRGIPNVLLRKLEKSATE